MTRSVIVAARRAPVAPRDGALSELSLHELAAPVVNAVLTDAGVEASEVGELILSNALGTGGNPARSVALASGLPERVGGLTIDRQCAGGLDAILLADAMIRAGVCDIVLAGGAESASRRPLRLRTFGDGRPPEPYDQAPFTPWPERDPNMAEAAQALAALRGITRAQQDDYAVRSHAKARRAPPPGLVTMAGLTTDPFARDLSERHCARAPVVCGDITAANMAVAADGAAMVVVMSETCAAQRGLQGLHIAGGCTRGGDPTLPGLAPVTAIRSVLDAANLSAHALSAAEIMEAFAVQAILCQQDAGIPPEIVNTHGGALARGHPIGASGAVLAVNLFHRLHSQPGTGLAAIASAGGLGTAMLLASG